MNKILFYRLFLVFALVAYLIPLGIALFTITSGNIPFWYDPARDFLMGLDNLHKPTLIGPTTGIPGIFYGPYWIWLLSLGLLFSHDPRFVVFLVLTIPYFLALPFILFKLSSLLDKVTAVILWLLVAFTYAQFYGTQPWNPNLAPLFFIGLSYLLSTVSYTPKKLKDFFMLSIVGFLSGLIINFHVSFGIGVAIGLYLFLISDLLFAIVKKSAKKEKTQILKDRAIVFLCISIGFVASFLPFFLFEVRHGFQQVKSALNVITTPGSVVTQKGLTDSQIIYNLFVKLSELLKISYSQLSLLVVSSLAVVSYEIWERKEKITESQRRLVTFVSISGVSILLIYLTSKNPVWSYHFVGIEMIFLLLIGFIISKSNLLKYTLLVWVLFLAMQNIQNFLAVLPQKPYASSSLATKEHIVKIIASDAKDIPYSLFAYSPSIYIYDYAYLFQWVGRKNVSYRPEEMTMDADIVYLIIPEETEAKTVDFINYRAPETMYRTVKTWDIPDGTKILKREKLKK